MLGKVNISYVFETHFKAYQFGLPPYSDVPNKRVVLNKRAVTK